MIAENEDMDRKIDSAGTEMYLPRGCSTES
jgi:hypothetical protein